MIGVPAWTLALSSLASALYATVAALLADSLVVVWVGIVIAAGNMVAAFLNAWVQRRPRHYDYDYDDDEPSAEEIGQAPRRARGRHRRNRHS